ncbi:MAG: hypothetical protein ACRCY3_03770, partial [Sphingorhabdus sp.]
MGQRFNGKNLPIIFGIIGSLIVVAIALYLYSNRQSVEGDKLVADASTEAEKAISAAGVTNTERAATEAIVRAYILQNPEIITEAVQILQKREVTKRIENAGGALTRPFPGAVGGNPDGAITIVEFTDYNCGFCRKAVADVSRLVA